jgi:hypothetical protein
MMKSLLLSLLCAYVALGAILPSPEDYRVKGLEKFGAKGNGSS